MKKFNFGLVISHLLLAALVGMIFFAPKKRSDLDPTALLVALAIVELLFLWSVFLQKSEWAESVYLHGAICRDS